MIYEVRWLTELLATSPEQAAKDAHRMMHSERATIMHVKNTKTKEEFVFDVETNPPKKIG